MNSIIIKIFKEFLDEYKDILISEEVVVNTPYAPFIPNKWNGTLVLAEAQNLSVKFQDYAKELNSSTFEEQIFRLKKPENLGVLPWDDHSLKIAVEVGLRQNYQKVAVSNACFWSQRDCEGKNKKPSKELQTLSIILWNRLFEIIKPKVILTVGVVPSSIISTTDFSARHYGLCHPSSNYLSRFSGLLSEETIIERFPEVKKIDDKYPEWMKQGSYRQNKLFYAVHALSKLRAI